MSVHNCRAMNAQAGETWRAGVGRCTSTPSLQLQGTGVLPVSLVRANAFPLCQPAFDILAKSQQQQKGGKGQQCPSLGSRGYRAGKRSPGAERWQQARRASESQQWDLPRAAPGQLRVPWYPGTRQPHPIPPGPMTAGSERTGREASLARTTHQPDTAT